MGIYDRDYQRQTDSRREYFSAGGPFSGLPPVTKYLLIINTAVFILINLFPFKTQFPPNGFWEKYFTVFPKDLVFTMQVWRLISYQFMHAGLGHILFNMITLYIFGPMVERAWGSRAYLRFYLIAGAVGGMVYTLLVFLRILWPGALVGASGSILGVIAVAGLLFPNNELLLLGIVPVRIAILAILAAIMSILGFLSGENAAGEAVHLTGMAVGVFYVYVKPRLTAWRMNRSRGAWQRKIKQQQDFEAEVDRILEKVHQSGIGSLTRREKEVLKEATRREQQQTTRV